MTIAATVPDAGDEALRFGDRCVACRRPATAASAIVLAKLVTNPRTGSQRPVRTTLRVPHCAGCARTTRTVFLAGLVPFVLGFLAAGGVAFAVVGFEALALGLDTVGRLNNSNSLVLGAAAGLFAGIAGGFLAELATRVMLLPVFGRALWRAPLLVPSLLFDVDYVAGLTVRTNADVSALSLQFADDAAAQAFLLANPAHARVA